MPIDIASGNVHLEFTDIAVPGQVALSFERRYSTSLVARQPGMFGPGWTSGFSATLTRHAGGFEFFSPVGGTELLPDPDGKVERGEMLRNLGAFLEIFVDRGRYIVRTWNIESGEVRCLCFEPVPHGNAMPLASIEDLSGQGLDLEWDDSRLLRVVRQRLERRELRFEYTRAGRLAAVKLLAAGEQHLVARYTYDGKERLAEAFDAADFADRFEYEESGRLAREIVKDGGVFQYQYDQRGRCTRRRGLGGYDDKRLRYLDATRITEVTDSLGLVRRYQYLPGGQIITAWSPLGAARRSEYDEAGRISMRIDAMGGATRYGYDEWGNRSSVTNALGAVTLTQFNSQHQPLSMTDARGRVWTRAYDASNRLSVLTNPLGQRWTFGYDTQGNLVEVLNPNGGHKHQTHQDGVLKTLTDWIGNETAFENDAFGRVVERRGTQGDITRFRYDPRGYPIQVVLPDTTTLSATYDRAGNMTRFVDGEGQVTQWRFGPCSRLLKRIDPLGHSVRYVWSSEPGEIDQIINELDEVYSFVRDDGNRIVEERGFDGVPRTFEYNAADEVVGWKNALEEHVVIERDAMQRVVAQGLPDGSRATFEFDAVGDLVAAENPNTRVEFERDPLGRIVSERQGDEWVRADYDAMGAVVRSETSTGYRASHGLDANGALISLEVHGAQVLSFKRNAHGQALASQLAGGLTLFQTFDSLGRLIEQRALHSEHPASETPLVQRRYAYDRCDRLTLIDDAAWGRTDYAYDPASRIIQTLQSRGASERFEYDPAGNVTRMRREGATLSDERLRHGPGNRLVEKGGARYDYDAVGRRCRKTDEHGNTWAYCWNVLDQLVSLVRPDGVVWRYRYDALGRRIEKSCAEPDAEPPRRFVWSGSVLSHETRDGGQAVQWIVDPNGHAPLAAVRDGEFFSVIADQLGNPRELVDAAGRIRWRARRATFGELEQADPRAAMVEGASAFIGQWFDDESDLAYNCFRYYDPECGSYITPDPIRLHGGNNLYRYCQNPVNCFDPLGLTCPHDTNGGEGYVVYHIKDENGVVLYVGITEADRFQTRLDEHIDSGRLSGTRTMEEAVHVDTYGQARGTEQAHIEHFDTRDTSLIGDHNYKQDPANRVNSFDTSRTDDRAAVYNQAYKSAMSGFD
jgi:RHS repeat-associated protein